MLVTGPPTARGTCSAAFVAEPRRQRCVPGLGTRHAVQELQTPHPAHRSGGPRWPSSIFSSSDLDLGADLQRPIRGRRTLRKDGPVVPQSGRREGVARPEIPYKVGGSGALAEDGLTPVLHKRPIHGIVTCAPGTACAAVPE